MQEALDALIDLLDLEAIEVNLFRGISPNEDQQRVFGGQVAGQALVAAARTVDADRAVHSLHAYFLRPGDPKVPILYQVDRIRDGKSFTTRRVVAIQHGRAIFNLQASFHVHEDDLEWQEPMPAGMPNPDSLPTFAQRTERYRQHPEMAKWIMHPRPIDTRDVEPMHTPRPGEATKHVWLKTDGTLPDDQVLHTCILTYASDLTLLDTILIPHGLTWDFHEGQMASLDHTMWFHRPFRTDEWLLYVQHSPTTGGARGLAMGTFYTQAGELVASVAQEGLLRTRRAGQSPS